MIPHKLTVRNFMAYRDDVPPLVFDGMHIMCLSGDNGAGKSTLIDAITWALWGEARAKTDDDLIALGADEMEVDFEWELNGTLHRVIRRRTKGKRGQHIVEFQMQNDDGTWRRVSGDTVRDTNQQITDALRMSYSTFINSAFLLQGRADEFTASKPQERKEVLVDILGLAEYEQLTEQAKLRRNRAEAQLRNLEGVISEYERVAQRRPLLAADLAEAETRVQAAQTEVTTVEQLVAGLREQREQFKQVAERRAGLADELEHKRAAHAEAQQVIAQRRDRIADYGGLVAQRDMITHAYADLQTQLRRLDELERLEPQAHKLGEVWQSHKEAINTARAEIQAQLTVANGELVKLDAEIAAQGKRQEQAQKLRGESSEYEALRIIVQQLRAEETALTERQAQIDKLLLDYKELKYTVDQARTEIEIVQQRLEATIERNRSQAERLPQIERDLAQTTRRLQAIEQQAAEHTELRSLTADDEREEARLHEQLAVITKQGKELGDKLRLVQMGEGICPVCQSQLGVDGQHAVEQQYKAEQGALRNAHRTVKQAAEQLSVVLVERRNLLSELETALAGRSAAERSQTTLLLQRDQAQLAQSELATAQADLVGYTDQLTQQAYAVDAQRELSLLQQRIDELGDKTQLRSRLQQVRGEIKQHEQRLAQATSLAQRLAEAEAAVRQGEEAAARRPRVASEATELQRQLDSDDFAHTERRALQTVRNEIDALGYTRIAHSTQKETVKQLEWARERIRDLEQATKELDREQAQLKRDEELAEHRLKAIINNEAQIAAHDAQLQGRRAVEMELQAKEDSLLRVRKQLELALREQGHAESELHQCDRMIEQLETYRAEANSVGEQRSIFSELTDALGKKGIQAMLIDNALPEIEHEANLLLGRMTDQQMHISLMTQRDSRKGDPLETLDILIADNLGTRDYALYSGGEAFRVNFALRIALSKLLAHRAGASLKTLVIDEGFGSQDGKGRERIVEAINAIADDFAKVIVITHIQELKDLFPTQIEITKGANGSTWQVM